MDTHPVMRIQFHLRGPFDPIETFSVTFLDDEWKPFESVVEGGSFPQYELWEHVAAHGAAFYERRLAGEQLELQYDESPGQ